VRPDCIWLVRGDVRLANAGGVCLSLGNCLHIVQLRDSMWLFTRSDLKNVPHYGDKIDPECVRWDRGGNGWLDKVA
jgi:hypothetical protein